MSNEQRTISNEQLEINKISTINARFSFHGVLRLLSLAFLLFAFFSCGLAAQSAPEKAAAENALPPNQTESGSVSHGNLFSFSPLPLNEPIPRRANFAVIPENVRPGEPVTLAYADNFFGPGSSELVAVLVDSRQRRQARAGFFSFTRDAHDREVKTAVLAVPSTAPFEEMTIRIETQGRIVKELPLIVEKRDFVAERIHLDERNTEIRSAPNPQRDAESAQLWNILSRTGSDIYATGFFIPPVSSTRRTSFFGDRRVFEYANGSTDTSIHAGVDYGVPKGTQVLACARGKVILAKHRIVSGNTVILEHLPGFYSLYYHLDSIEAGTVEGSIVEAGTLIGLSGSTGLSTGPHLHWEIRVATENTDPDAFLRRAILDKDEILSKLEG